MRRHGLPQAPYSGLRICLNSTNRLCREHRQRELENCAQHLSQNSRPRSLKNKRFASERLHLSTLASLLNKNTKTIRKWLPKWFPNPLNSSLRPLEINFKNGPEQKLPRISPERPSEEKNFKIGSNNCHDTFKIFGFLF